MQEPEHITINPLRLSGREERHTDPLQIIPPPTTVVERIIENPVDRIVEVEKPTEKIIERIIEKPVKEVVYVDKPVLVQQPAPPPERIEKEKEYIYIPSDQRTNSEVQPDRKTVEVEVKPEVRTEAKSPDNPVPIEAKPEAKIVSPEVTKTAQPERKSEEKSSKPEDKTSTSGTKKLKLYNGLGRRHTAAQIDEILDWYILYGELPDYVTDRQRYAYKHHVKLPERRQLLEQAGLIVSATKRRRKNSV